MTMVLGADGAWRDDLVELVNGDTRVWALLDLHKEVPLYSHPVEGTSVTDDQILALATHHEDLAGAIAARRTRTPRCYLAELERSVERDELGRPRWVVVAMERL